MMIARITATAHISKKEFNHIDDKLISVFNSLRLILKRYEKNLDVKANEKHHYELWTNRGYRHKRLYKKTSRGISFATIIILKKNVGFYFLPLNIHLIRNNIKPELKLFLKGLYTFHFNRLEPAVEKQIVEMVHDGWQYYKKEGLVQGSET